MMTKYCLLTGLLLTTSGCGGTSVTSKADTLIIDTPLAKERCLASNPKDVNMWINAMSGYGANKQYTLNSAFTVTTGTPGYKFALKVNRVVESFPEQVVLDLLVARPTGMVIQVITENKVNINMNGYQASEGSSVQVNCGGVPFFKVDKVMVVH